MNLIVSSLLFFYMYTVNTASAKTNVYTKLHSRIHLYRHLEIKKTHKCKHTLHLYKIHTLIHTYKQKYLQINKNMEMSLIE